MIGGVRVQVADTQLGSGLLDGAGLLDQGGDGVTHQLLAFNVVGRDQLVEVHVVLLGAVDQGLQPGFGFLQVGLERGIGLGIDLGHQLGQARAAQGAAVDLFVLAQVDVANALAIVEMRVVGVVAEAVVLVFGGVGLLS